ncbi:MAG: hypothetical protein MUD14_20310 [Hydrococcus sp. Prado102]|jgi:hypothetical protein|nr:hypothetical protein [Hydrococcus sp. Prado102]
MSNIAISDLHISEDFISELSETKLSVQGGLVHLIALGFIAGYVAGYYSH